MGLKLILEVTPWELWTYTNTTRCNITSVLQPSFILHSATKFQLRNRQNWQAIWAGNIEIEYILSLKTKIIRHQETSIAVFFPFNPFYSSRAQIVHATLELGVEVVSWKPSKKNQALSLSSTTKAKFKRHIPALTYDEVDMESYQPTICWKVAQMITWNKNQQHLSDQGRSYP